MKYAIHTVILRRLVGHVNLRQLTGRRWEAVMGNYSGGVLGLVQGI